MVELKVLDRKDGSGDLWWRIRFWGHHGETGRRLYIERTDVAEDEVVCCMVPGYSMSGNKHCDVSFDFKEPLKNFDQI